MAADKWGRKVVLRFLVRATGSGLQCVLLLLFDTFHRQKAKIGCFKWFSLPCVRCRLACMAETCELLHWERTAVAGMTNSVHSSRSAGRGSQRSSSTETLRCYFSIWTWHLECQWHCKLAVLTRVDASNIFRTEAFHILRPRDESRLDEWVVAWNPFEFELFEIALHSHPL